MRLKHFLFLVSLLCALAEIVMAVYAVHWGGIVQDIAYAAKSQPDSEILIVRALNILVPVGVCCLALLIYIWRMDSIGGFALFLAAGLHLIGVDLNVRAVKKIYGNGTALSDVTWWAPVEKHADSGDAPDDSQS